MDRVRISVAHRGAGVAPIFAALQGGYFAEQGLEVELVEYGGHARSIKGLIDGDVEFTNAVGPEVIMANRRHDGDAVVLASAIGRSAQQVSARPGISTRKQLRGKRWAIQALHDADHCSIQMAFDRWGWSIPNDAEIVVVGNDGPRLDLLLDEGKVDAAIMHAPEPFQALKRGWALVDDLGRLDVSFQNSCAASTRRLVKVQPDLVARYIRAFCKGVYRFRTDAQFGISVLRDQGVDGDEAVLESSWVLFARLMGGYLYPSLEGMRNACLVLEKIGALAKAADPYEHLDLAVVSRIEREGIFNDMMLGGTNRA